MIDQNPMNTNCSCCQKSKAQLICGACTLSVCKDCAHFLDDNHFSFLSSIPEALKHTVYCHSCFVQTVQEPLTQYDQTMEQAKNIDVFFKVQSKETRLLKRREKTLTVDACPDEQETLLRLAFKAAQLGFNGLIDVEVTGAKVRNGGYQTSVWKGSGIPTNVAHKKLLRDRSLIKYPN